MNNEDKILKMLESMQNDIGELKSDYRGLNQTVAKIENEHGNKLGIILDCQIGNNRSIEDLRQRMETHGKGRRQTRQCSNC